MADVIVVALISGGCSLAGVVLTIIASFRKIETALEKAQAVTDVKLEHLTEEVRKHNSFGDRIPRIEVEIQELNSRVDRIDSRISRLHHGE